MNKEAALKLRTAAQQAAILFSTPEREYNFDAEEFIVESIRPLSDDMAWVVMEKSPSGKRAGFLFYFLKTAQGQWRYFVPTDSHLQGLQELQRLGLKQELEEHNFPLNYIEKSVVRV